MWFQPFCHCLGKLGIIGIKSAEIVSGFFQSAYALFAEKVHPLRDALVRYGFAFGNNVANLVTLGNARTFCYAAVSTGCSVFLEYGAVSAIADSVKLAHTVDGIHSIIGIYPDIRIKAVSIFCITGIDN